MPTSLNNRWRYFFFLLIAGCVGLYSFVPGSWRMPFWGFYGHRLINRTAVYTLPEEMYPLYKQEIDYITEHAVDPDKRRYAVIGEAARHYIDLDHWGKKPFPDLPRSWLPAFIGKNTIELLDEKGEVLDAFPSLDSFIVRYPGTASFITSEAARHLSDEIWLLDSWPDSLQIGKTASWQINNELMAHGVVPYFIPLEYHRLVKAFLDNDPKQVLRLSADLGHYIADAHVPLHTTMNYNGQMTDQVGIHAFWESRIPELFAETQYDFLVGKAEYIRDINKFAWEVVMESNSFVDSVLQIEKRLSREIPEDEQYCFEERLSQIVRLPCAAYAAQYQQSLDGMVEARMQQSIMAVGSVWYSAWVDAGQPDLRDYLSINWDARDREADEWLDKAVRSGKVLGRPHE
ncbi:MAG: hypothetical protein KDC28_01790 [Saprospiraceae bacterium]|nr:hypothetical protein [Saprospiraceae bacterium]MCB9319019.1 hypothetical protein [Lewinellaceae bacterium]